MIKVFEEVAAAEETVALFTKDCSVGLWVNTYGERMALTSAWYVLVQLIVRGKNLSPPRFCHVRCVQGEADLINHNLIALLFKHSIF